MGFMTLFENMEFTDERTDEPPSLNPVFAGDPRRLLRAWV
jgi:hypothetical protein